MERIEVRQVSKSYGEIRAVNQATVSIPENCLYGLIGPDGAGKTTLFRMITTLLLPDQGDIRVFGFDSHKDYRKIRQFTGYMPAGFPFTGISLWRKTSDSMLRYSGLPLNRTTG